MRPKTLEESFPFSGSVWKDKNKIDFRPPPIPFRNWRIATCLESYVLRGLFDLKLVGEGVSFAL